jgi:FkbM family methyltransferase
VSASTAATTLARRAVRSSPRARALVAWPALRRAIGAQRAARSLRPAVRFLALEMRPGALGRYRLRRGGRSVHLRHGSRDVEIFNEIFARGRESYEPPVGVAAALDSLGPLRIGDLGANIGLFGVFALGRWPVAVMRSYEPDPANAALLRATIAANDAGEHWEAVPVAVSNADTTATFETGLLSESRLAGEGDGGANTIEVPVADLFAQPPVDLLKIDIEGAEWAILGDARLASHPARAVVLEWHRRMCPARDACGAARELLETAGYEAIDTEAEAPGEERVNGVMWGLRR